MQGIVTIKGKESGLEIFLDGKATYPALRDELMQKLKKHKDFFRDSQTKVAIRGKQMSEAQKLEIKRVFDMDYGIRDIVFGDEENTIKEVGLEIKKEVKKAPEKHKAKASREAELVSNAYFDAKSIFLNSTVRSGQRIECEGDVVVLGDVNPGGEVIAGGSIAVFGRLRGLAHAGCSGRTDVCVAALNMCPKQLRLSGRVVTFPSERESVDTAEVAELKEGKVVIRPVNYK
ncbi:MAG: septum site-determining protein MinC [Christensenellaceae bacterium]